MAKCVEKIPHSCGTKSGLQVFLQDDGTYDGFCFACGTYVADPYKDKPANYRPVVNKKSAEEIEQEMREIASLPSKALTDRKLRASTLEYFGVKTALSEEDGETVVAHYYPYTKQGKIVAYKARLVENKKMWAVGSMKETDLFGWDSAIATGAKKLFVTEGELDAMSLYQICTDHNKGTQYENYLPAVVSIPNGAGGAAKDLLRNLSKIREHFREIVLVFDMDAPGRDAVEKVLKAIPDCVVAHLPAKDVNECLVQGRSKACYNAVVFNASKPKNTRLVEAASIIEDARKEIQWGYSWPYKKLTEITRGIRKGETYYIGAGVKMGKSELLNDIAAWCIREHGWKVFVVKPEEANVRTLQGVVGKLANKIFHDPKIPFDYDAFDKHVKEVEGKLYMLNLYQELSWEGLKTDIRAAVSEGCEAVFIDPITVLSNGINAADANTLLQKMAQELAAMAMDLNFVAFMFAHLKSPETGPSHERGGAVQSHQFAGSRAMMRSAHLLIGLEGNKDPDLDDLERNVRSLVVLENRMSGETGRIKLFYDKNTGAFNEM